MVSARRDRKNGPYYRSMRDSSLLRMFVLPVIILLIIMNIFPLFWSLILSFSEYSAKRPLDWGRNPDMIGAENYSDILRDPQLWRRFFTTGRSGITNDKSLFCIS